MLLEARANINFCNPVMTQHGSAHYLLFGLWRHSVLNPYLTASMLDL